MENIKRSLTKTISWRIIGSADTFIVSYLITGTIEAAISISGIGLFTKMIMYFFHERIWRKKNEESKGKAQTMKKSLFKTMTWRLIGSFDTFVISYFILDTVATAATIGGLGFFTKSIEYFLHERLWNSKYLKNYGKTKYKVL